MKTIKFQIFSTLLILIFSLTSFSQNQAEVKAKIVLEDVEGNLKITGTAENLSEIVKSLKYKLSVIRKNKNNNRTNNSQEGVFTLEPNQNKNLSTTQINRNTDDEIIILLLFYNENNEIVSKDRVVVNEEKKKM